MTSWVTTPEPLMADGYCVFLTLIQTGLNPKLLSHLETRSLEDSNKLYWHNTVYSRRHE